MHAVCKGSREPRNKKDTKQESTNKKGILHPTRPMRIAIPKTANQTRMQRKRQENKGNPGKRKSAQNQSPSRLHTHNRPTPPSFLPTTRSKTPTIKTPPPH
ncbi:hypothetical protein BCR34DRAFT_592105 [Clohesyomyces aquaticus]|uniref:Uncharacterized protein n=1 Tax=Clohesyomyces aquaticus TaxID=1231657 RepID=A0A1Y1YV05_9PLEO|nr:hypothetical protein BCR34DRAFT_592105 [Clohesyomyces aquaticus]